MFHRLPKSNQAHIYMCRTNFSFLIQKSRAVFLKNALHSDFLKSSAQHFLQSEMPKTRQRSQIECSKSQKRKAAAEKFVFYLKVPRMRQKEKQKHSKKRLLLNFPQANGGQERAANWKNTKSRISKAKSSAVRQFCF